VNTAPSIDDLLAGVIIAIETDIVPEMQTMKGHATAQMMQSLLQGVRQLLPVYDTYVTDEHNGMTAVLRDAAAAIDGAEGDAADRIRERAATFGQWPDRPAPPDRAELVEAHRALGQALTDTMRDLDELQRAEVAGADAALDVLRGHLGPRYVRDTLTFCLDGGMLGRG
jgi:hypothetical protein